MTLRFRLFAGGAMPAEAGVNDATSVCRYRGRSDPTRFPIVVVVPKLMLPIATCCEDGLDSRYRQVLSRL